MTEALHPCECGEERPRLYSMAQQVLLPWQNNEVFFVQCPVCGRRTRGYELANVAVLRWNQRELLNKKKRRR